MPPSPDRLTVDLQRDVHCLFGLPVDNLTMAQTKALLRERCRQEGNTVLATININWVAESFRNPAFRDAIINSDLVVLDGMPLLWLAQLLGCPMKETVPGSTLIQELLEEHSDQPLTIFLFGGEGDVSERAMQRINERQRSGMCAVGSLNPGFGTVEEMSSEPIIEAINATAPDILLVALGAKKGTQWIEHNRNCLNAKIISHLGATINFLAGSVRRSPLLLQRYGLEWVWRILQEPKLFSRYAADGAALLSFLFPRLPLCWQYRRQRRQVEQYAKKIDFMSIYNQLDSIKVVLGPYLSRKHCLYLWEILTGPFQANKCVFFDLQHTEFADCTFWGTLLLLQRALSNNNGVKISCINANYNMKKWKRLFHFIPIKTKNSHRLW